jgi:hypothetical protein
MGPALRWENINGRRHLQHSSDTLLPVTAEEEGLPKMTYAARPARQDEPQNAGYTQQKNEAPVNCINSHLNGESWYGAEMDHWIL